MSGKRILIIDDDEAITTTVSRFLESRGYQTVVAAGGEEALRLLRESPFPLILSDIYMGRVSGLDILREAAVLDPGARVILMTARGSVETTVEAEEGGAFDYLAKPFDLEELLRVVERAAAREPETAAEAAGEPLSLMTGFSPGMVEVYKKIARAARSAETVLITGETGAGKELVARAIHEHGPRAGKPFVAVDCGAITGSLWESEVFGSVRGAFTGADRSRAGLAEAAEGGTLFFDEIGEVPPEFQPKLLRFLQEKEYRPVGSAASRRADVRIVAATNRDPDRLAREGKFREDLLYRLNVLRIHVPPLRARPADVPFLTRRFLAEAEEASGKRIRLDEAGMRLLEEHSWPGNVRELRNLIHRLAALHPAGSIPAGEIRRELGAAAEAEPRDLEERERRQILRVLEEAGGNKTRAAKILGIQRRTLYKKLERMNREERG